MRVGVRVAAVAAAGLMAVGLIPLGTTLPAMAKDARTADERLVDAVRTPKLGWYSCFGTAQCTTVAVPLDYDRPNGATTELAVLKIPAKNQKARIGTLFVNPGGPGGSATELAFVAREVFSPAVTDRFDVVGIDPRGIGYSDHVRCFTNSGRQATALAGYTSAFPLTAAQERAWVKSDKAVGKACSTNALSQSMSTAEVARDMELMRRAVGDAKLSYVGFSYGTYLGQVYANMFPKRFRAVAVDGVLDPVAWAGTRSNVNQPLEQRLNSSGGAWKALKEILARCDTVGEARCSFAAGDPVAKLAEIMGNLRKKPIVIEDPEFGSFEITYDAVVGAMLSALYSPEGYLDIIDLLTQLSTVSQPTRVQTRTTDPRAQQAEARLAAIMGGVEAERPVRAFPYENGVEAFASVTCTDSAERTRSVDYAGYAARQDTKAPYFGRAWMWSTSICAGDAWTGQDEDAYTGPFNRPTGASVLYVGNFYDPATNYAGAVSAAKRMPNSSLLRSDSWGHTAYGTSACATRAIDTYLLTGRAPKTGTLCKGDIQPFQANSRVAVAAAHARLAAMTRPLPRTTQGFR